MNEGLDIMLVANTETSVDGFGCGSPIFVQFETAHTSLGLLTQRARLTIIALAGDTYIERYNVSSLEHALDQPCAWCAGCCVGTSTDALSAVSTAW